MDKALIDLAYLLVLAALLCTAPFVDWRKEQPGTLRRKLAVASAWLGVAGVIFHLLGSFMGRTN